MWFRQIIQGVFPVGNSPQIEIQDPSEDIEVIMSVKKHLSDSPEILGMDLMIEMLPIQSRVDLVIRERSTQAVLGHLIPC